VAQASVIQDRAGLGGPRRRAGGPAAPPRLHLGRLAILVLVLIGASFYVSPLRDFFAQQDRYQKEAATLQAARADNTAFHHEVQLLSTESYVAQRARVDSMLVPPDTMVFVVKGLPGKEEATAAQPDRSPTEGSISVLDRIDDLWRTLLR
jgi:cell division protein FtsB